MSIDYFTKFHEEFGEDLVQEIFEAAWDDKSTDKIKVLDRETLDREGANIHATIELILPGKSIYINISSGNWNGSDISFYEVTEWTETEKEMEIAKAFYANKISKV